MSSQSSPKALIALVVFGLAIIAGPSGMALPIEPSAADRSFVADTARSSTAQVAEAKLALTNTERGDIRDFAQNLLNEHAVAAAQLRQIAADNRVNLPPPIDAADLSQLAKLRGEAFDRRYVADAQSALRDDIARSVREGRDGTNPGLQYFAARRLPRLLDEQRMIEQIAAGSTIGAEPPSPPLGWQYQPPPSH